MKEVKTAAEIDVAVDRVLTMVKKSSEPDGIPNSVCTITHWSNPGILNGIFNLAYKSRVLTMMF